MNRRGGGELNCGGRGISGGLGGKMNGKKTGRGRGCSCDGEEARRMRVTGGGWEMRGDNRTWGRRS